MAEDKKKEDVVEEKIEIEKVKEEAKEEALVTPATEKEKEKTPVSKEAKNEVKKDVALESDIDETVKVPKEFQKLVEQVEKMTVLELNELVKILEKRFGVSASAVAVAGPSVAGDAGGEEQSEFTVELTETGGAKIAVIKAVKEVLGLGLKEAKEIVDSAPSVIKEDVKKEDAEELKVKLEETGATITLK